MPLAVVPNLDEELGRLYALPLEEFTSARNDLAKRLRQAGQRERADEVKALPKPSLPVWAVNQLARRRPADVRALLDAAERLREAQERALAGKSSDVGGAMKTERQAVRTLTGALGEILGPRAATNAERVAALLRAAAVDEEGRRLLDSGRLTGELEPTGFELFAGAAPAAPARAPRRTDRKRDETRPRRDDVREEKRRRAGEARARVKELEAELKRLRAAATDAEREAERARGLAEAAEQDAERACRRVAEAEERARSARAELARLTK